MLKICEMRRWLIGEESDQITMCRGPQIMIEALSRPAASSARVLVLDGNSEHVGRI